MTYATSEHTYVSGPQTFTPAFEGAALHKSHIKVRVNDEGIYRAFNYVAATGVVTITGGSPLVGGDTVVITRVTPVADPFVDFKAGADVTKSNLDKGLRQALYGVQELNDRLATMVVAGPLTRTFLSDADVWVIPHDFTHLPDVTVTGPDGYVTLCEVVHTPGIVTLTFNVPVSGTATLS